MFTSDCSPRKSAPGAPLCGRRFATFKSRPPSSGEHFGASIALPCCMLLEPSQFDRHIAAMLSGALSRHPLFDRCVESAIGHHLLGGIPFAAALFYFWVQAWRENRQQDLCRWITILMASFIAIALALLASRWISWLPPQRMPGLAHLYRHYLAQDINANSFPSDSTSVFSCIAIGMIALNRRVGAALLAAVLVFVSLPRMYVGGHYLTDVLAGLAIGVISYAIARLFFERPLSTRIVALGNRPGAPQILLEICAFLWILEVAVSFREGQWIVNTLHYFHIHLFG